MECIVFVLGVCTDQAFEMQRCALCGACIWDVAYSLDSKNIAYMGSEIKLKTFENCASTLYDTIMHPVKKVILLGG